MDLRRDLAAWARLDQGIVSDCMMRLGIGGWMNAIHTVNGFEDGVAGPARTILFGPKRGADPFGKTMYALIEALQPGDVLVMAGGGTDDNLIGDNVAAYAQHCGLAAMIVDAMVRDARGMRPLSMPVFARGRTARMSLDSEPIAFDVPVVCAGAQVRPGDLVIGGYDGVLVLPPARIGDLLWQMEDVQQVEEELQRVIAAGGPAARIEPLLKQKKTPRPKPGA